MGGGGGEKKNKKSPYQFFISNFHKRRNKDINCYTRYKVLFICGELDVYYYKVPKY